MNPRILLPVSALAASLLGASALGLWAASGSSPTALRAPSADEVLVYELEYGGRSAIRLPDDTEVVATLAAQLAECPRPEPQQIANTLWAQAVVRAQIPAVTGALQALALPTLRSFEPQHVATAVRAGGWPPGTITREMAHRGLSSRSTQTIRDLAL